MNSRMNAFVQKVQDNGDDKWSKWQYSQSQAEKELNKKQKQREIKGKG